MSEPFVSKYTAPEIEALLDMVHDGKGGSGFTVTNKKILDKFTEDSDGNLLYNGKQVFLSKPESTTENTSNN